MSIWRVILRGPSAWQLARWRRLALRINRLEPGLVDLPDEELRKRALSLRYRAKSREPRARLLPETYALVREAARRTIGLRHFDVQLLGGAALAHRTVAEMQTGEGKTLTATLPLCLYALEGRGAHLVTANDYLARRDAQWMEPVYRALGLSVGVVESTSDDAQRRAAYACDVTYGTAREFGFDFLRDRLKQRTAGSRPSGGLAVGWSANGAVAAGVVQRAHHFCLVDEADSILIDDAGTPLVISAASGPEQISWETGYRWSAEVARQFVEGEHYDYDHPTRRVELNAGGRQLARATPKPAEMGPLTLPIIYEFLERAIRVERDFHRDRDYVVVGGEVQIVDEFSGRVSEGRKWRDGVHQAVEAREGLKITGGGGQAARITVQDFFLRYRHLAGMTGTARDSRWELAGIYELGVLAIPTNRPPKRQAWPTQVFGTADAKWSAIVEEVRQLHATGRPVLIGTRSIDKSEHLSRLLAAANIPHQVLNAHRIAEEAEIVAAAGQRGRVTVATNMAGRGTDIQLGPGMGELGGLHVICTEMHDAARIDRQLIGRTGRQGDPGTYRQYLALDDEILRAGLGPAAGQRLQERGARQPGLQGAGDGLFRRAQHRIQRAKYRQRRVLLYYERQRHKMLTEMGQDPYLDAPG